jgi:Zn-dependent protease with chaperone function
MLTGYFLDGEWAEMRGATAHLEGSAENGSWVFAEVGTNKMLARWPATELVRKPSRKGLMRLSATGAALGARFVLRDKAMIAEAERDMPALKRQRKRQRADQMGLLFASTALLAGVVALYIWGIPLAAGPITAAMPAEWESELGRSVAVQIETSLGSDTRMRACDPDPQSPGNVAIATFVSRVLGDRSPPFPIEVMVGRSEVPNAFAIPGGQIYYLSALLSETETGDEFAGVLAHEMGHVMYRHAMQSVISAAGTGLVIGFILGDMTGLSVVGGLGTMIIDSRNSREAERESDAFAAEAAKRLGYAPTSLADLLDRVAEDESGAAVFALLSSHPLTAERRQNLRVLTEDASATSTAFTPDEWRAIKAMCGPKNVSVRVDAGARGRSEDRASETED